MRAVRVHLLDKGGNPVEERIIACAEELAEFVGQYAVAQGLDPDSANDPSIQDGRSNGYINFTPVDILREHLPLQSYHFSLGNSSEGTIGFCARVQAVSRQEAVDKLREAMQCVAEVQLRKIAGFDDDVEYINVYTNDSPITTRDIDETDPVKSQ